MTTTSGHPRPMKATDTRCPECGSTHDPYWCYSTTDTDVWSCRCGHDWVISVDIPPPRRVLVIGSPTWHDTATIRAALLAVWADGTTVLVTGCCAHGADAYAERTWMGWGGLVDRHPTERSPRPSETDTAMIAQGADLCLGFLHGHDAAASSTVDLAEAAGIPTHRYHQPLQVS